MIGVPLGAGEADGRQRGLIAAGTRLLHGLWPGIEVNAFALPDDGGAVLLVQPARGGVSLFVAGDGSVMFAASALEPGAALELFRSGKRTDPAEFVPSGEGGRA